jgi:autophagy-related protein 5
MITNTTLKLGEPQTLGKALNTLLPSLFPSRRTVILARPVLHGAVVPLGAPVEEVMRAAAYADGWVHLGIMMMG